MVDRNGDGFIDASDLSQVPGSPNLLGGRMALQKPLWPYVILGPHNPMISHFRATLLFFPAQLYVALMFFSESKIVGFIIISSFSPLN